MEWSTTITHIWLPWSSIQMKSTFTFYSHFQPLTHCIYLQYHSWFTRILFILLQMLVKVICQQQNNWLIIRFKWAYTGLKTFWSGLVTSRLSNCLYRLDRNDNLLEILAYLRSNRVFYGNEFRKPCVTA